MDGEEWRRLGALTLLYLANVAVIYLIQSFL